MTTYYVSSINGSDNNAGTSGSAPLASLQAAENLVKPGDTVEVMNGTYTGPAGGNVLTISTSGTASAPITFEAAPGATPVINSSGDWQGIEIDASYITINGFTVVGDAANYNLASATAGYGTGNADLDGNGIAATSGALVHNLIIENNTVYNEPGGGIGIGDGDYLQILNNNVHDNAHWSAYGDSGISIGSSQNFDNGPASHIIIEGNTSINNSELVPEYRAGKITDGEGIILDSNSGYTGGFLIEDNTTSGSSGPGIESFLSNNAVITGNTTTGDLTNAALVSEGEIFINQSTGDTVTNNVTSAAPPPPPAGQLVTNGSFETHDFGGWTLGGNSGASTYGAQISIDTDAESGAYAAGLGSIGSDGTLSQTIATTAGTTYTLSFWLQNEGSGTNDFKAIWNGQALVSLTNAAQSGYTQYTYTVTATGSSSTLEFSALNDASQWDLDNISLTANGTTSSISGTSGSGTTGGGTTVTGISESLTSGALNAGKTVTLTLGFSSAVTVAGKPTLTLNDGGTATYASGSGTNTLTFTYTAAAGQNTPDLMVTAVNLASGSTITNSAGAAANLSLASLTQSSPSIDTTAPAAPVISSDTVSGNTVTLKGTAEANSTITAFDNSTTLGTATTNSSGTWTFSTGALASGSQSFTATATDGAGNVSPASSALGVTLAAGSSGSSASSGANLVTNESFETDSFSGWTVGGNSGASTYGAQIFIDTDAESGAYAAGLGSMGSDGTLSQTVATTAGDTYTLSFWLQNEAAGANDFKAIWNGQALVSLTNAAQSGYTQYTYTVTATGSSSTLEFSARNDPSQWDLDNVSLTLPALTVETVAVSGTAAEGQTLTAKVTDNDPNATIGYQWQYENGSTWANIAGATASTFTVGVPQEGEILRVIATAVDGATTLSATSSATTAIKAAAPVLTIAHNLLSVTAGGSVALGVSVTVPEAGDTVNVKIAGLPSYETITDALDHKVFSGNSATLTAAEVDSGLTLSSSYTGSGRPVATLTLSATNGANSAALTTASQTLTVTDPPSQLSASGSRDLASILFDSNTILGHREHDAGTGVGLPISNTVHATALELLMQHTAGGFSGLSDYGSGGTIAPYLGSGMEQLGRSSTGLSHA
jgi:Bacterial Ig domain/Protein of unknown function (DUF642)